MKLQEVEFPNVYILIKATNTKLAKTLVALTPTCTHNAGIVFNSTVKIKAFITRVKTLTAFGQMDNGTLPSVCFSGCNCEKTASFDFKCKKRGKRFNVYKGHMYSCCNNIQPAIVKISAHEKGSRKELSDHIRASQAATDFSLKFSKFSKRNAVVEFPEQHLAVMDTVAIFNKIFSWDCRNISSSEYVLFEPYIKNLQYFVTVDGTVTSTCPVVLEELCHFSFYESNCTNILRGLRGAWEKNGRSFRLASPATKYFPEKCDASEIPIKTAIKNFFGTHKCTALCEQWPVSIQMPTVNLAFQHDVNKSSLSRPPSYHSILEDH